MTKALQTVPVSMSMVLLSQLLSTRVQMVMALFMATTAKLPGCRKIIFMFPFIVKKVVAVQVLSVVWRVTGLTVTTVQQFLPTVQL